MDSHRKKAREYHNYTIRKPIRRFQLQKQVLKFLSYKGLITLNGKGATILSLTTYSPTITVTENITVTPDLASIILTTYSIGVSNGAFSQLKVKVGGTFQPYSVKNKQGTFEPKLVKVKQSGIFVEV